MRLDQFTFALRHQVLPARECRAIDAASSTESLEQIRDCSLKGFCDPLEGSDPGLPSSPFRVRSMNLVDTRVLSKVNLSPPLGLPQFTDSTA